MIKGNLRLLFFSLAFLFFINSFLCINASAAEEMNTYYFPELTMTIDVPSSISVVMNNVKKNDPLFYSGTFDYIETMAKMRSDQALLYGKSLQDNFEIEIVSTESNRHIKKLTDLSEKKLNKLLLDYSKEDSIVSANIYSNESMIYFQSLKSFETGTVRVFYHDYYTIYNDNAITVRLISSAGTLSDKEASYLKEIVDSVRFPVKKKLDFSQIEWNGTLFTFSLLSVLFILAMIYKRFDDSVNSFFLRIIVRLQDKTDRKSNKSDSSDTIQDEYETNDDTAKPEYADSSDDDDLSSIDLDEAIAAFDDSLK